ncbi:hypothetical protein TanjilG_20938 [Lupinus angustifolius]|uniref:DUF4283 domain-containing protein n=1 Tax=Lupinus angustifolius TaxID=3871 RepID=A0A1J7GPI3_LUPAN|nr:hypothetical protein TanjilG_20938 [Lupinus angustifolius]
MTLKDILCSKGLLTIKVHPMGGNLVLLSPLEGEDILEILKDAEGCLHKVFSSLSPWSEEVEVDFRIKWITIMGIPLHA